MLGSAVSSSWQIDNLQGMAWNFSLEEYSIYGSNRSNPFTQIGFEFQGMLLLHQDLLFVAKHSGIC